MKSRFSTLDVFAVVHDLRTLEGLRVTNVYDVDSKTYLIRMHIPDEKCFIMIESGMRLHKTSFEWPKAQFPSSFSMKLRKHIKQKRLVKVEQLGVDRIVDLQFGTDDRASHVIVELYDRGNILLTDHQYVILNVLRPRTDKDTEVRFSVRETYPTKNARQEAMVPSKARLMETLATTKKGESVRRALAPLTQYGPALIEHSLRLAGICSNAQIGVNISNSEEDIQKLLNAMDIAQVVFNELRETSAHGFIVYKLETRADGLAFESYQEFHPYRFKQFESENIREFENFSDCVDEYFSKIESQRADQRALNVEREALKKLENVKRDQQERIESLELAQIEKRQMAELIELNSNLVDKALLIIRSAVANQLSWEMIEEMRIKASEAGDPIASSIVGLNLNSNEMILSLRDPYHDDSLPKKVPVDIALSAYQNSRKLHSEKKAAVDKKQKTISSSAKALKSAQLKAKETLATVRAKADVVKSRRQMWFEKFFWFVSSENYLVIGGRDAQQNELLVKRYLRTGDIYVHADVRGASSVVIRNKISGGEIPPKTLNEAGSMAVCYSSSWEAKVIAAAWWVYHHQVSRTAPTGEYLTPGSFMIRGKKNYLPSCQLQMGFGLMFKLDEDSVERHRGERGVAITPTVDSESLSANSPDEVEDEVDLGASESEEDEEEEGEGETKHTSSDNDEQFPDVQVSLGGIVNVGGSAEDGEEYSIIQVGPMVGPIRTENERATEKYVENMRKQMETASKKNRPLTIRQKHKAQKIKKKYADQEEDERIMRAIWLGSREVPTKEYQDEEDVKETSRKNDTEIANVSGHRSTTAELDEERQGKKNHDIVRATAKVQEEEEEVDESDLRSMGEEETKMLDSLTWRPLPGDTLLHAVVVVAPYQTMLNFKYKVKLTPGTGKRGKAAKNAIALFQRERNAPPEERNLLRVLAADDQIARNIPGKVRISAPHLNKK